ncbi:TIGR03503 family protein [Pseudoalteromonas sp. MMG013]|uniref:TIGR03503 family protein n=1 Tax=Pseudoalteromonas sp. MMG013 TaxID=2822687 RepID=UPI001B367457|nr:TIGR03503 family protein [Pseudoalteromonas sp. MMG013]MBQ4863305.1 TIGR03503 family protein [Pseudoalteromonas sp. MMG013]
MRRLIVGALLIAIGFGALALPSITLLQRNGKINEIPLLDNRFRIDHKVDKITLLFFRTRGAPAVVLVKPDGSKLYAPQALKNENLDWFDEPSYDLITISNPTPGPWQVVGSIQPNSRIMVLGEVELHVDPLPPLLFRGETLKVSGHITNDGKPIQTGYFRDVVSLFVEFTSTNNNNYANFGAGTQSVTAFKDDGREFDERPMDGIFTGEFKLSFPAGEWQPEFFIETPILKRRVVKEPLIIAEPPFDYHLELATDKESEHELLLRIDQDIVKPETVIFQGKIFYPNGEEKMFTLNEEARLYRKVMIQNYDWGRYSIELSAFGENVNGREFMATLPMYKFEIERPIEKVPELPLAEQKMADQEKAAEIVDDTMSSSTMIAIILFGNLMVLLFGWLAIRIFVQNKPIKLRFKLPSFKKKSELEIEETEIENQKSDGNGSKNDKSGDILNLSMSDD